MFLGKMIVPDSLLHRKVFFTPSEKKIKKKPDHPIWEKPPKY